MLRSSAGCLYKGVAKAASSLVSDIPTVAAFPRSRLVVEATRSRQRRHHSLRRATAAQLGSKLSTADFRSLSYFSASQPYDPSLTQQINALQLERYLPPLLDADLIAQNDAQQALFTAIQDLDADASWHLYRQLGKARRNLSTPVIDLLITLQCRIPVRNSRGNLVDSQAAVRQVCDRILSLCRDRSRYQAGSSSKLLAPASDGDGLSQLSSELSLRLLYLLIVEEEQIAASRSTPGSRRRSNLSSILSTLSANIDAHKDSIETNIDVSLRGRLAATLSRLGATDAAHHQLQSLLEQANQADVVTSIDPRPFDQLLLALAREASSNPLHDDRLLPSPVDLDSKPIDAKNPIVRALRLALSSDVQVSKANVHKCLQALDSATLWWLLPFELDGTRPHNSFTDPRPDDRYPLKAKWHPWQTSADGIVISQDCLDSFAERVALVLAQRGILLPSLHLVNALQDSTEESRNGTHITTKIPDHDFFTVVLEKLAQRMASDSQKHARKSTDMHRGISTDLDLVMKVYGTADSIGVDLDSRLNEAVVKAMSSCLPASITDLGPERARFTEFKAQIAQRNEQRGSKQALKRYIRLFTSMVLRKDPDLSKRSLSYPAQATLLGLHMRTRDYTFSKRMYQLIRLHESASELWSADPQAGSLRYSALHRLAGPDRDAFMWLFAGSIRSVANTPFAVQLYLDWLASGNVFPTSLNANFVRGLLRADMLPVVRRVLLEFQGNRGLLHAGLARSLVISFADAGLPDLAVELVMNVTRLTASSGLLQDASTKTDTASGTQDSWLLGSTLELMSLALDRSSRVPPSNDGDSHRKVLRIFEEFRLGLTHHLFKTTARDYVTSQAQPESKPTIRDVRMAYNASLRASLSIMPNPLEDSANIDADRLGVDWGTIESTCLHVEELFKELEDLGAEPDDDSWNLRLTSSLHATLAARSCVEREAWLAKMLELFNLAYKQAFKADGPLRPPDHIVPARQCDATASQGQHVQRVVLHTAVVAVAIDACRRCGDLSAGLSVHELHMRHSGFNVQVEKARLMLLADLAEPPQWQNELDILMRNPKSTFMPDKHFLKQLQMLSSAAKQRTTDSG